MAKPFKLFSFKDTYKEPKKEIQPHIITEYEKKLIEFLTPVIRNRQLIKFWYKDTDKDLEQWRTIEPHLIGQTKFKAANIFLVGWFIPTLEQLQEGQEEKWGNYILDNVSQLEVLKETYKIPRFGYNPDDKRMTSIFCAT